MQDLKDVTRETHYENYRTQCIQSMTRMVVKERNRKYGLGVGCQDRGSGGISSLWGEPILLQVAISGDRGCVRVHAGQCGGLGEEASVVWWDARVRWGPFPCLWAEAVLGGMLWR